MPGSNPRFSYREETGKILFLKECLNVFRGHGCSIEQVFLVDSVTTRDPFVTGVGVRQALRVSRVESGPKLGSLFWVPSPFAAGCDIYGTDERFDKDLEDEDRDLNDAGTTLGYSSTVCAREVRVIFTNIQEK